MKPHIYKQNGYWNVRHLGHSVTAKDFDMALYLARFAWRSSIIKEAGRRANAEADLRQYNPRAG